MKIRNGFVSNSSSSSFIIVGIKLDNSITHEELAKKYLTEDAIKEYIGEDIDNFGSGSNWWSDLWYECAWEGNFINEDMRYIKNENDQWLGKVLADDDELDGFLSISELSKISKDLGFEEECKLHFGTRYC